MRRRNVLTSITSFVVLPSGCSRVDLINAATSTSGLSVQRGLAYGAANRQQLDLYRREDAALASPVIVFFYGGSWQAGSRDDQRFIAAALARRGFVVAVPDYRVYPEVVFPTFLQDCAAAVAWVNQRIGEYGGDSARVTLVGHSAGAYNAAMLGLDASRLQAAGTGRESLAGIVGLAGPYDFVPAGPELVRVFASVNGGPASQPINYVDGRNPPMLLLVGDADRTVSPADSTRLAERIKSAGGPARAKTYPGIGHFGIVTSFMPVFRLRAPVLEDVVNFAAGPASFIANSAA